MAISRDKKNALVAELAELLASAKGTAFASYQGLTVADVQALRRAAEDRGGGSLRGGRGGAGRLRMAGDAAPHRPAGRARLQDPAARQVGLLYPARPQQPGGLRA